MPSAQAPVPESAADNTGEIYERYNEHITSLPVILAAVAALTDSIESYPLRTVVETLSLLSNHVEVLKSRTGLPLIVGSGVDAFRQWLVLLLERPAAGHTLEPPFVQAAPSEEFEERKRWIVAAGRAYVAHGLAAKKAIAEHVTTAFRDLDIPLILVPTCDEVVSSALQRLAQEGVQFRVFLVDPPVSGPPAGLLGEERNKAAHDNLQAELQESSIPVTKIPPQAIVSCLNSRAAGFSKLVFTSGSLICSNGAVVAPLGTYQAAALAKQWNVPFYVAAEHFKAGNFFPLNGQNGAGIELFKRPGRDSEIEEVFWDVTPANLITNIVTERGFTTPAQISDMSVKAWF